MKKQKKKKRFITLIEVMIVILLIGIISGALAVNMRGSMNEGKAFKTHQNISRIENILLLEEAKGEETMEDIVGHWEETVKRSPLIKNPEEAICDGWKTKFSVTQNNGEMTIKSEKLNTYEASKKPKKA